MSAEIRWDFLYFMTCVATGVLLMAGYDVLRAIRRTFAHGRVLQSLGDFFYWSAAGILVFSIGVIKNSGVLRGFAFAAVILGMTLYHKSVSKYFLRALTVVFGILVRIICRILSIMIFPFSFLHEKIRKNARKVLKKSRKEVKIALLKLRGNK